MISKDELVKWLNEKIKVIDEYTKIERTVLKDIENFLKQYKVPKIDAEEVKNEDS